MYNFNNTELSYEDRMKDLMYHLTVDEKIKMLTTHHFPVERLGIGEWWVGTEVARGFVGRDENTKSTVFPQPIGMASMFDAEIMKRIGKVASDEARAYYNRDKKSYLCLWGPTVDMERHPLWGRTEEGYGEDTCLTGKMSLNYTLGLLGEDSRYYKTVPTLKHFCANNNEEHRASCNASVPKRLLHEYYYRAFEPAIRFGGAKSVMTAYNEVNHCPADMNTDVRVLLKNIWGLNYVVTDGGDFCQNLVYHGVCQSHAEAVAYCLHAGIDCFTDVDELVHSAVYSALNKRLITMEDIDKAVYNALLCRMKLGHFDNECPYDAITTDIVNDDDAKALNLEACKKGITLLKNDDILPLDSSKSVAVVGFLADTMLLDWYTGISPYRVTSLEAIKEKFSKVAFDNGFDIVAIKCNNGKYLSVSEDGTISATADTISEAEQFELHDWDDDLINLYSVKLKKYVYVKDDNSVVAKTDEVYGWFTKETLKLKHLYDDNRVVIQDYLHYRKFNVEDNGTLTMSEPCSFNTPNQKFEIQTVSKGTDRVSKLAKDYDYTIVFAGNDPEQYARECYDRKSLNLPPTQSEIIKACYNANSNTILTLVSSYPYAINWEQKHLKGIVYTSHAGAELGNAIVSTLIGENNPAGRTPLTWYKSLDDIPNIMEYDITKGLTYMYYQGEPLYPFGYGLSYSTFEYSNMVCTATAIGFKVSVSITNTSDIDGDEVLQLYYSMPTSKLKRAIKKLFDFKRIHIKAGETVTFTKEYNMLNSEDSVYFEVFDVAKNTVIVEEGTYQIMIGSSSDNIKSTFNVEFGIDKVTNRNVMHEVGSIFYDSSVGTEIRYCKEQYKHYVYCSNWNGSLHYNSCVIDNSEYIQIKSASILKDGKIVVKANGKEVCTINVPVSDDLVNIQEYTGHFDHVLNGIYDLELCITEGMAISSFRVYKKVLLKY